MSRYRNETPDGYRYCFRTLIYNGTPFMEQTTGSRKTIYLEGRPAFSMIPSEGLDIGGIDKKEFTSFLASFNKNLYANIRSNEKLFYLDIKFKGYSRDRNIKYWNKLKKGTYFYNLDLNSAYWQIARRLGYIDQNLFEKYQSNIYKQVKRYCVSFLGRRCYAQYHDKRKNDFIECDVTLLKKIYDNIRNELYICISKAVDVCENKYIEYNIDGLSVCAQEVDAVRKIFKELNLSYKIFECQKINNYEYTKLGEIRTFRTKT